MATQSYLTDLQVINTASVQNKSPATTIGGGTVTSHNQTSTPTHKVVVTTVVPYSQHQQSGQAATIIQAHTGQQYSINTGVHKVASTSVATVQSNQQPSQATSIIQPAQAHSGQQYIVTTVGDNSVSDQASESLSVPQDSSGASAYQQHVQYVEGNDPGLYAATNGQMQGSYSEYSQTPMYTSYTPYQASSGSQVVTQVPGQIITHQGSTYLLQGTLDTEGIPLGHPSRAPPTTVSSVTAAFPRQVQWLIDNYETADGVSLPRSTLYNHYLRHCHGQSLDPMNPASFGKLIRSVFLGLRTRRLGTRGNSKYHYYGIRIKAGSNLNQFTDHEYLSFRQQYPIMHGGKRAITAKLEGSESSDNPQGPLSGGSSSSAEGPTSQQQQHQQFLGDASGAIPNFGEIEFLPGTVPEGITKEQLRTFEKMYREHADAILDVVVNLQFPLIEALWQGFWRHQPLDHQSIDNEYERRLPKHVLYAMCQSDAVQRYVRRSDYAFYQALVEVLIPDVLRPIPSSLTQAIRNFAKSLENWLKASLSGVPEEMIRTKLGAVSAFAQTLRRYTSLNHLAQAARAVLQNTSQITQMLTDLNRVDFANVQEQASWVCQCDDGVVQQLEVDFKKTLQQQNTLEQWAVWLEGVVNQVLKPHEGSLNFPKAARQFLLKWSFYSSMVIRDLTLRSAASFGSFHLIRLLYDEYMFYLVEHKVAAATGETPIAVMGEVKQFIDLGGAIALSTMDDESDNSAASSPQQISLNSQNSIGSLNVNTASSTLAQFNSVMGQQQSILSPSLFHNSTVTTASNNSLLSGMHTAAPANASLLTRAAVPTVTTLPINTNNTTVTVLATNSSLGNKTIRVIPVNTSAAGDANSSPMKRLKSDISS